MATSKKFTSKITQDNDTWTAQILRRKTARETLVSKSQDGFSTEAAANEWAETELKSYLKSLNERNKRR